MAENKNSLEYYRNLSSLNFTEKVLVESNVINAMFHGGIPRRSMLQIVSESGVGKSTVLLQMAKELCDKGYTCAFIDAEKGLSTNTIKDSGLSKYYGNQFVAIPESDINKINNLLHNICTNNEADFVFLDSIAVLDSNSFSDSKSEITNQKVGGDSKYIRALLKQMNRLAIEHNTTFIYINHIIYAIISIAVLFIVITFLHKILSNFHFGGVSSRRTGKRKRLVREYARINLFCFCVVSGYCCSLISSIFLMISEA